MKADKWRKNRWNYILPVFRGTESDPEIVAEAKKVLNRVAEVYGHNMLFEDILMGGASIDVHGVPLTEEAVEKAKAADAVLMGSIGGNTTTSPWYKLPPQPSSGGRASCYQKGIEPFCKPSSGCPL